MQTSLFRVLSLPLVSAMTLGSVLHALNSFSHLYDSSHLPGLLKGLSQHAPVIMADINQGLIVAAPFSGAFGMTASFSSPKPVRRTGIPFCGEENKPGEAE